MDGTRRPQRDAGGHLGRDVRTRAGGSSGLPESQAVHFHQYHYHGAVNNVGTAINANFGVNYGSIQHHGQFQPPPSSSHISASGSGWVGNPGYPPPGAGLVVSHTSGLADLLNPIPNASHTRNPALSPPNSRCFEGTRVEVIKKIDSWVDSPLLGNPHIMWIYGYAGCGKSAIAQVVAEDMSAEGRLAASFFFFRGSDGRDRIARLATTIASQLAVAIPPTAAMIKAAVQAIPGLLSTEVTTVGAQFQHLIYDPLNAWAVGRGQTAASVGREAVLIVLDGVDECEDREQIAAFIKHAIRFFDKNPLTPLRFLITSRVENHLYQRLHSSNQVELLDLVEHTSDADIATALDAAIADEKRGLPYACEASWPGDEDKERLVEHIGGSYIFMTTLVKLLFDQGGNQKETPMQRLPRLLSVKPDFDSLYKTILKTSEELPHFLDVITVVALAEEPLSIVQIADILNIGTFLVSRVLANLHAIMQVPGDDRSPVTLWHTSLRDFLCSKDRAGPSFFADPTHHLYLAVRCATFFNRTPQSLANPSWKGYVSRHAESHIQRFLRGWDSTTWSIDARTVSSLPDALGQPCFQEQCTIIERACLGRWWTLADALVAASAGVTVEYQVQDKPGSESALHACAAHDKHAIARFLLEHGANPNAKDLAGDTPLYNASWCGHVKVMQHLLDFGADPNIQNNLEQTLLHCACFHGHVEGARLLLYHNASPSIKDRWGETPLQRARRNSKESIIALFLERGITK